MKVFAATDPGSATKPNEGADPLGERHPRNKRSDDAAALIAHFD